jgi:hypothetical protein
MKVWTFEIIGGEEISLQLPGSPPLRHLGVAAKSLWKMVGNEEQADAARAILKTHGCKVQRYCEQQTPEQEAERRRLLGLDED